MDVGLESANVFPIFEKYDLKPLAIKFTSVILLLSTLKVSEMQLLSFVRPIIELRTFHVVRISLEFIVLVFGLALHNIVQVSKF